MQLWRIRRVHCLGIKLANKTKVLSDNLFRSRNLNVLVLRLKRPSICVIEISIHHVYPVFAPWVLHRSWIKLWEQVRLAFYVQFLWIVEFWKKWQTFMIQRGLCENFDVIKTSSNLSIEWRQQTINLNTKSFETSPSMYSCLRRGTWNECGEVISFAKLLSVSQKMSLSDLRQGKHSNSFFSAIL